MVDDALISVDDLVARIRKREPIDAIVRSVLPPAHREAFRRCALVRSFDDAFYESTLRPDGMGVPTFADIVASDDVEALPRRPGVHRLHADAARRWFRAWWDDVDEGIDSAGIPAPLREMATRLAGTYRRDGRPIDELANLALVDDVQARALFVRLFDAADERFDLARCQDLVDAVGHDDRDRNRLLPPSLRHAVDDRARYLRVRALWADDWHRTARFLDPGDLTPWFEWLLDGRSSRFLELHARGGMGKTMRLRWLSARWLVPRRVPVARIDFDLVDPLTATSDPWLVLVELARQLSDQLAGQPFTELLADYGRYLPLLHRWMEDAGTAATSFDIPTIRQRAAADVTARFSAAIDESAMTVIIVFDTMEEAVLRPAVNMALLRDMLQRLHQTTRFARLVFSGRYELGDKAPTFAEAFPNMVTVEIEPFSESDAVRYLHDRRGIENDELVDVAVERSDGLPFKLALFADLLLERPDISVDDLRSYHDPDLLYLIERVVQRLPEYGVRWLLRYGALPRVLTRAFAADFLATYIARGMSGDRQFDEPRLDEVPATSTRATRAPWRTDHDLAEVDGHLLWEGLRAYGASASWVTSVGTDVLRFHPDVVNPMRRILRDQPAFERLNAGAIDYFLARASQELHQWGVWMREAFHHAFQLEGDAATAWWRVAVQHAAAIGRHDWQRDLARAVLDRERTDGLERVPLDDGSELLTVEALALAHFEMAAADADDAAMLDVGAAHELWASARSHLDAALALPGREAIAVERLALVQVALLRKDAQHDRSNGPTMLAEAVDRLHSAAAAAEEQLGRMRIAGMLAEVLADQRELDSAMDVALPALGHLAALPNGLAEEVAAQHLLRSLVYVARAALRAGQLGGATQLLDRCVDAAAQAGIEPMADLDVLRAEIDLRSGAPTRAIAHLDPDKTLTVSDVRRRDALSLAHARALLASHRPTDALVMLESVRSTLLLNSPSLSLTQDDTRVRATAQELAGEARRAVGEFGDAAEALEIALSVWNEAGALDRAAGVKCRAVALLLHAVGDLRQAMAHLQSAESLGPEPGSDPWVSTRVLRAELVARMGNRAQATTLLSNTATQLIDSSPDRVIAVAMSGLAVDGDAGLEWLKMLRDQVAGIHPAWTRLAYLGGLARVDSLTRQQSSGIRHDLGGLFPDPLAPDVVPASFSPRDRLLLALRSFDLRRVIGRDAEAMGDLRDQLGWIDESADPFLMLHALQVAGRLGAWDLVRLTPDRVAALLTALESFPTMAGITLVLQATAALRTGEPTTARDLTIAAEDNLFRGAAEFTGSMAQALRVRSAAEQEMGLQSDAAETAARAVATLRRLGEPVDTSPDQADSGRHRLTVVVRRAAAGTSDDPPSIEIERRTSGAEATIRRVGAEHPVLESLLGAANPFQTRPAVDNSLKVRLGDVLHSPMEVSVANAAATVDDWYGLGHALGSIVFDAAWPRDVTAPDVALLVEDRRLASAPWELMRLPDGTLLSLHPDLGTLVRESRDPASDRTETGVIQMALSALGPATLAVDGVMGPASRTALRAFQRAQGLDVTGDVDQPTVTAIRDGLSSAGTVDRPRVIVARPSYDRLVSKTRGDTVEGSDVAWVYERLGYAVLILENPTPKSLSDALRDSPRYRQAAVVHLSAGITIAAGTAALDLGEVRSPGPRSVDRPTDQLLTVSGIDRVLRSGARSPWAPLVVLDVPRPPTDTEAGRLLLLRNLFASDLFELGTTAAVIGTGLAQHGTSNAQEHLIGTLRHGGSLGHAVTSVRELADASLPEPGFSESLAFAATALFTQVPWIGIPWSAP